MNIRQERYLYSFHVAVHIFFLKYDGQYSSLCPEEVTKRQEQIKQAVKKCCLSCNISALSVVIRTERERKDRIMKTNFRKCAAFICILALLASFTVAFADNGINNQIIIPAGSNPQAGGGAAYQNGLRLIRDTGDGERITLPKSNSYLDEPEVLYVNAPKKHSIYAYQLPKADKNKLMAFAYHGIRVLAVAVQDVFTCIIYNDNKNNSHAAWVESRYLSVGFPGREYTLGLPCVSYAYSIGDPPVSWSDENFVGSGQRYTVLNEKAYGCVQLTLDYQVIGRGEAAQPGEIYGPRIVYVNDGSGWLEVGQFDYDSIDAVHATVNLSEPMDIVAVATIALCDMPDTFLFRQSVLDVMTK